MKRLVPPGGHPFPRGFRCVPELTLGRDFTRLQNTVPGGGGVLVHSLSHPAEGAAPTS